MCFKLLLIFSLLVLLPLIDARRGARNVTKRTMTHDSGEFEPVTVKSISCINDAKYIRDVSCLLHSTNRTHKRLFVTFYVINEEDNISLQLKHTTRNRNNLYTPGHYDITIKLCDFVNNLHNDVPSLQKVLLDKFSPYWQTLYGHLLHPCPYQGILTVNQSITGLPKNWKFSDLTPNFRAVPSKWESKTEISLFNGNMMGQKAAFTLVVRNSNY